MGGYEMGSIIAKKKKGQIYYYYVESARVNGKPRIVAQKYLGRAEKIAQSFESTDGLEIPKYSIVQEYGAVCALFELSQKLDVVNCIDRHCPKRKQGLSVGEYLLLAAINRAVNPVSKSQISDWYSTTTLHRLIPAQKSLLSSKRFWDNMALVPESAIEKIEDELTALIVKQYGVDTDCLIYDTTNFFTFIDTNSEGELAQRGKCKSKRTDLKIVGLAMMVSPDFKIPLFHETYPGNLHDSEKFHQIIDKLKSRLQKVGVQPGRITVAFDKGNNSLANVDKIFGKDKNEELAFHVVGSIKFSEHKELLDIPKSDFLLVPEYKDNGVTAYRLTKSVYERDMTVVITHNPALLEGQLQGIHKAIEKCMGQFDDLQHRLLKRKGGEIKKGKKPTLESVQKNVQDILHADYMRHVFEVTVIEEDGFVLLDYDFSMEKLDYVCERYLGKTLLFTDNHDWDTGKIISAYRSMHHVESAFRQMKDTDFLGFRPIYHWTDQKIKVHAFYCVLALRLCFLLQRTLAENGMLYNFMDYKNRNIEQVHIVLLGIIVPAHVCTYSNCRCI
jgi:transposase